MNDQLNQHELLLSILFQGRNDAYMGDFNWRLSTVLNKCSENIVFLGIEDSIEILVCDWGSEKIPLCMSLELTETSRRMVKFLIIPPEVASMYDQGTGFSTSHAINSIARRSNGKYVMVAHSDVYIPLESLAKLTYFLKRGYFHSFNLSDSFFWASRYHVPNDFIAGSPFREHLEEHIQSHWNSYVHETVSVDHFSGPGACLLLSKQMLYESKGLDEQIRSKDLGDIDITRRLLSKYRWDDLENHGVRIFHLEHLTDRDHQKQPTEDNQSVPEPGTFGPNPHNWGLSDHCLNFVDGYGISIGQGLQRHHTNFNPQIPLLTVQDIVSTDPRYNDITLRFEFDPHSFFSNSDAIQCLLYVLQPESVCEIGSWMGASARCFAAYPSVKKVVCVDHWDRNRIEKYQPGVHPERLMNNMYEQFLANAVHSGTDANTYPLRLDSDSAVRYCTDLNHRFDLVYIDGDHTTVGARADILRWSPLLNAGGYICGDDWSWQKEPDNVAGAVVSVAKEKGWQVFFHGNFWLMMQGGFSIQPLTIEVLRTISPIKREISKYTKVAGSVDTGPFPLVSIFCTCKNAEKTIRRHLKAVACAMQTYSNIEYIVQDAMSTDGTLAIFDEFKEVFGERLKLISEPDSCSEEGFWRALSRCNGEILCASLADEELLPDAIPYIVEQFRSHPEIDVIHGDIYTTDIEGNSPKRNPSREFNLIHLLADRLPMHFAASFFRKTALVKAKLLPYPNTYGLLTDDFFIWVYLGLTVKIKYVPVVFAKYAVHENALSVRGDRLIDYTSKRVSFIEQILFDGSFTQEEINLIRSNFYTVAIQRLTNANFISEAQKYREILDKLMAPPSTPAINQTP